MSEEKVKDVEVKVHYFEPGVGSTPFLLAVNTGVRFTVKMNVDGDQVKYTVGKGAGFPAFSVTETDQDGNYKSQNYFLTESLPLFMMLCDYAHLRGVEDGK